MRRTLIAVVIVCSFASSACTAFKEAKVSTWKNTTSVEAMERLLWQEAKAGNWVEVEAHLASNFTNSTPAGVLDKAQTVELWRNQVHDQKMVDFSLGEFNVTDNGETTVVTYAATLSGSGSEAGPSRRLAVWQKQKSGWVRIAASQSTGASQTPKM